MRRKTKHCPNVHHLPFHWCPLPLVFFQFGPINLHTDSSL